MQERIRERAIGEDLSKALNPALQVKKIVLEELTATLGGETLRISYASKPPTVVLMAGLQGSGKTTNSAKLARWFKAQGRNPILVGADLQRPAAVAQLRTLAARIDVPVYSADDDVVASGTGDPVEVAKGALAEARRLGRDVVICDTAGRLAIDEELMEQVRLISEELQPDYTFLVVDAMTGQDAVRSAKAFNEALELDGVIMTKLDGDARGGAALSVKSVTGVPIKFVGTGEQIDALEDFHAERMAGRILGMGDVVTLVEEAQRKFDQDEMKRQEERLRAGEFTLDDFKKVLLQTRRLGPLGKVLGMIPGMGGMQEMLAGADLDKDVNRLFGIIDAMTPSERRNPSRVVDQSRRRRIATGAGVDPHEVGDLVKQFDGMSAMMKGMAGLGMRDRLREVQRLQAQMSNPAARLGRPKGDTGKRLTADERRKQKKQREKDARRKKRG
jgi:signal recognition particle subunit SRP54